MHSILNAKREFTPKKRSLLRAGLYSAVAGSAFIGSEALSHTVTLNADGSTATGPLFGATSGPAVPHVHPGDAAASLNTSFSSSTSGFSNLETLPTSRGSAEPGVVNFIGELEPITPISEVQRWASGQTASTSPIYFPTQQTQTTQVTLLDPQQQVQIGDVATSVETKNFRNIQSAVESTEKLTDGTLSLTLKNGELMTAAAGDYAFNGGDVWLASNIAGELGTITETTSVLSRIYGVGGGWGLPVAAGVLGIGALGLGAAAATGNLSNPFANDGSDGADGADGADGTDGTDGTDGSGDGDGDSDGTGDGTDDGSGTVDGGDDILTEEVDDGSDPEFTITNTDPENVGPTALTFSQFSNSSGSYDLVEADSVVGTLSASDPEEDELMYRIESQHLGSEITNIFEINENGELVINERLDYSQPGNDADGTRFDQNIATVVVEVSDGSALTSFRTFEFTISNSTDDDGPLEYVREANITRLKFNGLNSTSSGAADSTDWLPFMDEAEYHHNLDGGEDMIASFHSEVENAFSVHELTGTGGFSNTRNYSTNSTEIDAEYRIHEVRALDMDDIDGDGFTDIVVAGRGGTNSTDSVVQIWEVGKSGEFTFKAADKDSEPSMVEDVLIGHFNSDNASKETSPTNMKKIMVIGGGTNDVAAEDALYSVYYDDLEYAFNSEQLQGGWNYGEVESLIINDTEYAVGIYGTNGGDGIGMVFLDGDADDGIVSAGTGISHNDIAVIGNVVFTATDKGIYYSKAFHSGLDSPEALSITNDGLHIADIKASQITAGNFDGDEDLELAVLDVLDQTPIIRFFDVDLTNPQVVTQMFTTEPVPGAVELQVIPGSIEQAERSDGNIDADELLVGINEAGTSSYLDSDGESISQTWNGSIIFYDDTSL